MKQPKRPSKKYKKLLANLRQACRFLGWEFSLWTDAIRRCDIEDGFAFTLDKVEYYVALSDVPLLHGQAVAYHAGMIAQYFGNREEPPSEEPEVLKGVDTACPESLLLRILDSHWQVRRQWVMEALIPEEQG